MDTHNKPMIPQGSPPLARERRGISRRVLNNGRITPACAGKTVEFGVSMTQQQDHPRLRGKDLSTPLRLGKRLGSPPLARERHSLSTFLRYLPRITPACAGKTSILKYLAESSRDHPRLRGKDSSSSYTPRAQEGSPPLARERPALTIPLNSALRITPACAGKTSR